MTSSSSAVRNSQSRKSLSSRPFTVSSSVPGTTPISSQMLPDRTRLTRTMNAWPPDPERIEGGAPHWAAPPPSVYRKRARFHLNQSRRSKRRNQAESGTSAFVAHADSGIGNDDGADHQAGAVVSLFASHQGATVYRYAIAFAAGTVTLKVAVFPGVRASVVT